MNPQASAVQLRAFSHENDLKRHTTSVHEKAQYPCLCGKAFNRNDNKLRHQKTCGKGSDFQIPLDLNIANGITPTTSIKPSSPQLEASLAQAGEVEPPWRETKLQKGRGCSKSYDRRFRVLRGMQIVRPTLSSKTTWLSKLRGDAVTYFRDDNGDGVCFCQVLYCYGSSWQSLFTRMQRDMGVVFHKVFQQQTITHKPQRKYTSVSTY